MRALPAVDAMLVTAEGYQRLCEELETLRGEARLALARVAEPNGDGIAGVGSSLLRELETGELAECELVGAGEANLGEALVSVDAPVGRAVLGAVGGDTVAVACPRGELRFEVISVVGRAHSERRAA